MDGFNENNMNEFAPPSKKNLKIVVLMLVMLIAAAVAVIAVVISGSKKDAENKEKNSHKAAVETYTEAMYETDAFDDFINVTMPADVLKQYKKTDNYYEEKNDYKYMLERNENITVSSIKKGDMLSDNELKFAEGYFGEQADYHDIDVVNIEITEAYEYSFKLKNAEYENKDTYTRVVCAVKVKGDGWKIIPLDAESLCEMYGSDDE
ncbi:MAG: hypothetical protein IKK47_07245 [Ruminococcus sp.]|nr:hypothetical protein [Ruminococcus sp.]